MAYPILVNAGPERKNDDLKNNATPDQRTLATVEFVENECIIPDEVDVDEVFDIKIVYKLTTIETRNYKGILAEDNFSFYDGGFFYLWSWLIFIYIRYWVWRFSQMDLSVLQGITNPTYVVAKSHGRGYMTPPQKWTWTFHGTISQLIGERPSTSGPVNVGWALTGWNYGWFEIQAFVGDWTPTQNFFEKCEGGCQLTKSIKVNLIPTPPYPLFNLDLCSVSKESVAPNESFNIKVTIVNQNHYSGAYKIDCYCSGNKTNLVTGTIGGNATKTQTFSVTASQLANQEFTESQYIYPEIAVSNSGGETDRWLLAEIAVIVIPGEETGTLSGRVTDKDTGLALSGVSVSTVGKTVTTNSSGNYTFGELAVGSYSVKFSKAGYWDETKSKTIIAGENTLNFAMTPESEPPPDHEIPWGLIAGLAGMGGVVALVLVVAKKRGKEK